MHCLGRHFDGRSVRYSRTKVCTRHVLLPRVLPANERFPWKSIQPMEKRHATLWVSKVSDKLFCRKIDENDVCRYKCTKFGEKKQL